MSLPSFEETNNPGYDEVFNKNKQEFSLFKKIGEFLFKPKFKSIGEDIDRRSVLDKIKDGDILGVFKVMNSGYKLSKREHTEFLKKMLPEINHGRNILEDALGQGVSIPDQALIAYVLHDHASFNLDIYYYLVAKEEHQTYPCKYPRLKELYEEKFDDFEFKRNLFLNWKDIVIDAYTDKAEYRTSSNKDNFYLSPHDYFDLKVWRPLTLGEHLFSTVSQDEYVKFLLMLTSYPKVSKNIDRDDIAWCKQNSAFHKANSMAATIEYNGYFNKSRAESNEKPLVEVEMPTTCKGVLQEIKHIYSEIKQDYELLPLDGQLEVTNMYKNRLPQLLKNYKDISINFRNGEVEDVKSPNELLYTSLVDIQTILNVKMEIIKDQKLENLNMSSKYIKDIKKKMFP